MLNNFKINNLNPPKFYTTINGINEINKTVITPIPEEFQVSGTISWKIVNFENRNYDAILGQNILNPLKALINLEHQYIEIRKQKIFFLNSDYPFDTINSLEPSKNNLLENLNLDHINTKQRYKLESLIHSFKDIFYSEGDTLSFTHEIQHEIPTNSNQPTYSKIYRYPKVHEKEIEHQIEEMLEQGIIVESNSPYNSPLWIVPKKVDNSGIKKWRIVIDYRKLNEITVNDKFPIPNIENILDKLGRSQYFTTLDLAKGFHQILVRPEDRKKTAFSTPLGHFEFARMPFGLKNAPSTFQRLMNSVLRKFINKTCVVYLDDILVFSTSFEEHIDNLQKIFNTLKEAKLKVQINKCNFMNLQTEFLGHILTAKGIQPNPNKIQIIQNLKLPTTQKQIKSFLGTTGYYRKFIKDYSKVAFPLTKYLKKNSKVNPNDPNYISAFEKLKNLVTEHPILRYPNFNKRFRIYTDASNFALGAVLTQEGHPICYASRTLNTHEINYSTTEKELLAIVWGVKYFRPYVYGKEFDLHTDHQPLKWLQAKNTGRDINPRLQRWLIQLGEYDAIIDYVKGKENKIADFLSRINIDNDEINLLEENEDDEVNIEDLNINPREEVNDNESMEISTVHSQEEQLNDHIPILDTIVNRFKTQIIICNEKNIEYEEKLGNRRIFIERRDIPDNISDIVKKYIKNGKTAIYSEIEDSRYNVVQQKLIELFSNNRKINFVKCSFLAKDLNSEEEAIRQLSLYHTKESGHSGIIANYEGVKRKIFYPQLKLLIYKIINNCETCSRAKYDRNPIKQKFNKTETPLDINDIVHMDTYVNSKHSFLIFIDKLTKHAVAFFLEDRNNRTIIEKLRLYISIKGKMRKLISDNEFNSINIKEFFRSEGIETHFTKPNSHTGNSDIERLNNTITERIRALNLENKIPIKDQIIKAIDLYNNSFHSTIKETPQNAQNRKVEKQTLIDRIERAKDKTISKRNETREEYEENRQVGFIKNYANLRHKEQPKFRRHKLTNIHTSNIKRPFKFPENINNTNDSNIIVTDHHNTNHTINTNPNN